jgi:hypothetical protein
MWNGCTQSCGSQTPTLPAPCTAVPVVTPRAVSAPPCSTINVLADAGTLILSTMWRAPLVWLALNVVRFLLLLLFKPVFALTMPLSLRDITFLSAAGLRGSVCLILAQVSPGWGAGSETRGSLLVHARGPWCCACYFEWDEGGIQPVCGPRTLCCTSASCLALTVPRSGEVRSGALPLRQTDRQTEPLAMNHGV